MDIFQILFYQPTFNMMVLFSNWFGNIGWAIIIIALIAKLITLPMTRSQIQNAEKTKILQVKMKELRVKYKHNEEKLAQEMAKLQASALPGQLGGCLSIIIFLILFIQIRGVIIDLVNRGYHAYNQVAYTETLKKKEDFVKVTLPPGFTYGAHNLELNLTADNGTTLKKVYDFNFAADKTKESDAIKAAYVVLSDADKQKQKQAIIDLEALERKADIGVYSKTMDESLTNITVASFLFFTTDSTSARIITDNAPDLTFYVRPPSNKSIDYSKLAVKLDGQDITTQTQYQQGDLLNLDFAGTNLSRVASDFDMLNLAITLPYILLSIFSGFTQFFVNKLYSANADVAATVETKPEDHDGKANVAGAKKKKEDAEPDFAETMAQSTKQMNYIFPVLTVFMSLGYLGGASFLPMGVTLFWTAQNSFVIIQQMISQRKQLMEKLDQKWSKFRRRFIPGLVSEKV